MRQKIRGTRLCEFLLVGEKWIFQTYTSVFCAHRLIFSYISHTWKSDHSIRKCAQCIILNTYCYSRIFSRKYNVSYFSIYRYLWYRVINNHASHYWYMGFAFLFSSCNNNYLRSNHVFSFWVEDLHVRSVFNSSSCKVFTCLWAIHSRGCCVWHFAWIIRKRSLL